MGRSARPAWAAVLASALCAALVAKTASPNFLTGAAAAPRRPSGPRTALQASATATETVRDEGDGKKIVYSYLRQDYALIDVKSETLGEKVDTFLASVTPWSETENKVREFYDNASPKWRKSSFGPDNDVELRQIFRAVADVAGGEEAALAVIMRNKAISFFGPAQIRSAGKELVEGFGKERALQVIMKNPGVLTINPPDIKDNLVSINAMAEVVSVALDNGEVTKAVFGGLGYAVIGALLKALFDVVQRQAWAPPPV
mmetsp:Transcript_74621/g.218590  ORF Transcript_74621/g.218590 Transcript_74621/m.218590 type:complete len:258 (+) Transcript_74621:34-807(+)